MLDSQNPNKMLLKDKIWGGFCILLGIILSICLIMDYKPFQSQLNPTQTSEYKSMISSGYFIEKTYSDFQDTIKNKENAIYYLGYEGCPWCEDILPILLEVLKENNLTINYINTKGLKEDKDNYALMQECLTDILDENKKIYVPNVLVISNGKVEAHHIGTVADHKASERELTLMETEEIREIYEKMLAGVNE